MTPEKLAQTHIVDIPHALAEAINANPGKTALIYFGNKITYRELGRGVMQFSRLFANAAQGRHADRIALLMPNIPQFVMAYYGALHSRNIAVPINFASIAKKLKTSVAKDINIEELGDIRAQLTNCRPNTVVVADIFLPIVEKLKPELLGATIIVVDIADLFPWHFKLLYRLKMWREKRSIRIPQGVRALRITINNAGDGYDVDGGNALETVAQFQYTGGTTGGPKAVMLSHRNIVTNAWQCREHFSMLKENDVVLGALPFFHVYGLTICLNITILTLRGTLVLMPSFSPKEALKLIERHHVTVFPGVSRMFQAIADYPRLSNFQLPPFMAISGAGHLPKDIRDNFTKKTGNAILNGYGLSEASPVLAATLPQDIAEGGEGNVGRSLPETEVRIVHQDTGEDIPPGAKESGEIVVRGPQIMMGYFGNAEATARVLKGGWLHTGDIGRVDETGRLYILDRADDMAKVLGEKVFSAHVEENIRECPGVVKCAVIFTDDAKRGKAPIAFLVVRGGVSDTDIARELRAHIKNNLWFPREIFTISLETFEGWEEITGKVKRKKIRDHYAHMRKAGS